jgi:alpha-D-xyloside xylohydrolase
VANTGRAYGQALEVRLYGRTPGAFDLFEDDGKTFDYERGRYRIRRLSVEAGEGGRFSLKESVVKDAAPSMFGRTEFRAMTR